MAIEVQCPCGKRLQADDEQAGRKVRCPACNTVVDVPAPAEPAGYAVERVRKCPGCKREWPTDTVVCVECGYNFETGRKMRTKYHIPDRVVEVRGLLGTRTRYRVSRGVRGKPWLSVSQTLFSIPLGTRNYDLSAYRAILTDCAVGDEESSDVFYLELEGPGERSVNIFRSSNEEAMRELLDLVVQAGRLEIKRK
jgi:hypothetical protein